MIPKIIWQTYEIDYQNLPNKALILIDSWKKNNAEWEYNYISAEQRKTFVKEHFGEEWYSIYSSYRLNVLRSDLWRYMCLYVHGGMYSDLDMLCKTPVERWLDTNKDFVVSIEPDFEGYTQSIFASSPNNSVLKEVLDLIKEQYHKKIEYNDVISYETQETGYVIFSKAITSYLHKNPSYNVDLLTGEESKNLHIDSIDHYYAGNGGIFDDSYISWKNETI